MNLKTRTGSSHSIVAQLLVPILTMQALACSASTDSTASVDERDQPLGTAESAIFYPTKYHIEAFHSGKCLDVPAERQDDNGVLIQQWQCWSDVDSSPQQLWGFDQKETDEFGNPVFQIASRSSSYDKCLDVLDGVMRAGQPVQQWDCSADTVQQRWIQEPTDYYDADDNRYWLYRSKKNRAYCLDVSGVSSANGARLQIWPCHGGINQRFVNVPRGDL